MSKIIKCITILLCTSYSYTYAQLKIDSVRIYNKFYRANSTAVLLDAFKNPDEHKDYVDVLERELKINLVGWSKALISATKKKHFQMKVPGINFAGEFYVNGDAHFFVFCSNYLLIDLSNKRNYFIKEKDYSVFDEILKKDKQD